jgi:hypothetical protein
MQKRLTFKAEPSLCSIVFEVTGGGGLKCLSGGYVRYVEHMLTVCLISSKKILKTIELTIYAEHMPNIWFLKSLKIIFIKLFLKTYIKYKAYIKYMLNICLIYALYILIYIYIK